MKKKVFEDVEIKFMSYSTNVCLLDSIVDQEFSGIYDDGEFGDLTPRP